MARIQPALASVVFIVDVIGQQIKASETQAGLTIKALHMDGGPLLVCTALH